MNCRGYNAFGRRKREIARNDKPDEDALDATQRGQLREEITIESNAILTFERREERLMDPTEGTIIDFNMFTYTLICLEVMRFKYARSRKSVRAIVATLRVVPNENVPVLPSAHANGPTIMILDL